MKALYNISYGLYVLTAKTNKYNGCIINTLMQVTSSPARISITVNKDNFTTKMIEQTGEFNVSILDMTTSFDLIQHFGFSSGKDVDKFKDFKDFLLANNQIPYITKHTNAYISAKVVSKIDVGTHITFVADITNDVVLSMNEPVTYSYYINTIKPKPEKKKKRVYVCRICGYVYEGDELPNDFICPICKHGAEDFELLEESQQGAAKDNANNQSCTTTKYYCPVCGNLEEAASPMAQCIICGADMVKFTI